MKIKLVVILFLLLSIKKSFSNESFTFTQSRVYGNVNLCLSTKYIQNEKINKVFIYAQLVEKLCKELNYKEQIFLDFTQAYTNKTKLDCFVSYGYGHSIYNREGEKPVFNKKVITVRQIGVVFNVEKVLKLIEFSIKNLAEIKAKQKIIKFKNYSIESIDSIGLKKVLELPNTNLITKVMSNRINRPIENFKTGISYYFKDNKFTLFTVDYKGEKKITTVDNIFQFKWISNYTVLIFDTNESFIYMSSLNDLYVSKRHVIDNVEDNYKDFNVSSLGIGSTLIRTSFFSKKLGSTKERLMVYFGGNDILIQDLNKVLEKEIHSPKKEEEKGIWESIKSYFD